MPEEVVVRPKSRGPKPPEIDWNRVQEYARAWAPQSEIAAGIGVSKDQLNRAIKQLPQEDI